MNLKLVVKAPNQKYGDQTFDVEASWSVKQLKTFLSNEYPSKPAIGDQRLIYSGHLLRDDQALVDVFSPVSSNDSIVTIHLVCAQKASDTPSNMRPSTESVNINTRNGSSLDFNVNRDQPNLVNNASGFATGSSVSQSQSQAATAAALTSSILAQMNSNSAGNLFASFANPLVNPLMANAYLPLAAPAIIPPTLVGQSVNLSPEEISTMNQLYTRLLSSNPSSPAPLMVPGLSNPFALNPLLVNVQMAQAMLQQSQQVNPPQQQQQAQQAPQAPNQQPPVPPQALVDDDEVDNRDWLDMFHWISRAVVLFSIVYFYSSVTRFILVISFALFLYFYQTGFFFPRNPLDGGHPARANLPHERPQAPRAPVDENVAEQEDLNPLHNAAQRADLAGGLRARRRVSSDTSDQTEAHTSPVVTDERSSNLRMIWLVISSLFTSLIPEQPQVNLH